MRSELEKSLFSGFLGLNCPGRPTQKRVVDSAWRTSARFGLRSGLKLIIRVTDHRPMICLWPGSGERQLSVHKAAQTNANGIKQVCR
jgi:hypothetical protein